jgi:hypothetical protein
VLLLPAGTSAANKGALKLGEPVTVNGTQLATGEYRLTWAGAGPDIQLNIIKSNKIVATVPAQLVNLSRTGNNEGYGTRKEDDGSRSLTAIYFSGKKYELAFGQTPATTDMPNDEGHDK